MNPHLLPRRIPFVQAVALTVSLASVVVASPAEAATSFSGVAAGDATTTSVTLWTRAVDTVTPNATTVLSVLITTDPAFLTGISTLPGCTTNALKDFTCKVNLTQLTPGTVYFYRFMSSSGDVSNTGRLKTAPDASVKAPVHFAFSGDYDGLIRPYALATQVPLQNLDFYVSLGDVIYETASNLTTSGAHNGQSWLNSPSVTLSGASSSLNGVPTFTGFATQAQLKSDYEKKYREQFLPVNTGGQNALQPMYSGQSNYTTWDNHELGNRQYINGGAPAGGSIGGAAGTDMPTGRGVDARANGAGNPGNINDVNTSPTDYMNRALGFQALRDVFLSYMPMLDRGTISAPTDPRTDGSKQLYSAQTWGKNAIYITTDSRSYRDLRMKTIDGSADDTSSPRADNIARTYLGATQLAWLKQTLLDAQNAGTRWKFITISDPIDQIGPLGGSLALANLPSFGAGSTYSPVNADGGKSFIGGYRAERNDLLKFIADHRIANVVFIATDDHQNRINELTYSPSGSTGTQSTYVKLPFAFSIVAGPLGATGPDLITNHTFAMAQQYANSINAAQQAAGVEPVGLIGNIAVYNVVRDGDPTAGTNPQPVDFYSPDSFNFTVLDVSANGSALTVKSVGMDATAQNAGIEYANGPQARTIFSFNMDAAPTVEGVRINDGSAQRSKVNQVTVTLNGVVAANSIAPGAFLLTRAEGGSFGTVVKSVSVSGRQTLVTLGFTGSGVGSDGALPDGSYTVSIDRRKLPLDAVADVTAIASFGTLFGDIDGDGQIDGSEVAFSAHHNGAQVGDADYLWYLDFDASGDINGKDHREVARRNGGQ
jgi:phosphodiesterase/alkaline phosphatase D-like protein